MDNGDNVPNHNLGNTSEVISMRSGLKLNKMKYLQIVEPILSYFHCVLLE